MKNIVASIDFNIILPIKEVLDCRNLFRLVTPSAWLGKTNLGSSLFSSIFLSENCTIDSIRFKTCCGVSHKTFCS